MQNIDFLTVKQVIVIHEYSIAEYGGDPSLLNRGLLEAAVAMPRQTFDGIYVHETIAAMAAAYLFHLCKNHPFADGNKRTAAGAASTFLDNNLSDVPITDPELADITLAVADGSMGKDALTAFFEERVGNA